MSPEKQNIPRPGDALRGDDPELNDTSAYDDLGGHTPNEISPDSRAAMLRAGLGKPADVARAAAHDYYEQEFRLTGDRQSDPNVDLATIEEAKSAARRALIKALRAQGYSEAAIAARLRASSDKK